MLQGWVHMRGCKYCLSSIDRSEVRYHCHTCQIDVCRKCATKGDNATISNKFPQPLEPSSPRAQRSRSAEPPNMYLRSKERLDRSRSPGVASGRSQSPPHHGHEVPVSPHHRHEVVQRMSYVNGNSSPGLPLSPSYSSSGLPLSQSANWREGRDASSVGSLFAGSAALHQTSHTLPTTPRISSTAPLAPAPPAPPAPPAMPPAHTPPQVYRDTSSVPPAPPMPTLPPAHAPPAPPMPTMPPAHTPPQVYRDTSPVPTIQVPPAPPMPTLPPAHAPPQVYRAPSPVSTISSMSTAPSTPRSPYMESRRPVSLQRKRKNLGRVAFASQAQWTFFDDEEPLNHTVANMMLPIRPDGQMKRCHPAHLCATWCPCGSACSEHGGAVRPNGDPSLEQLAACRMNGLCRCPYKKPCAEFRRSPPAEVEPAQLQGLAVPLAQGQAVGMTAPMMMPAMPYTGNLLTPQFQAWSHHHPALPNLPIPHQQPGPAPISAVFPNYQGSSLRQIYVC